MGDFRAGDADVAGRPAGAGRSALRPGADRPLAAGPVRVVRVAAAVAGLAAIAAYLGVALARLWYPGHLEILEENSLVEVHRILTGQPLYAAPSASYVPDGYTPLYFAVSAAAARVLGQSYLPLRLVSLAASLVCFAVLGRLVQRETGSRAAGLAAAGLFAATYFATDTWFDIGRVDSLFLALSVAGLYAVRHARRPRGAVAAGLLLGAAFLTKQSALAEGVAVLAALAVPSKGPSLAPSQGVAQAPSPGLPAGPSPAPGSGARRRLLLPAAVTYAVVVAGSTLVLGLTSHGWYLYYVFELMSHHALSASSAGQFWTTGLLLTLGIAICAVLLGIRRIPLVLLAGCAALAVESFGARAQTGSNVNDLLPAYLVVAVLAGLALGGRALGGLAARLGAGSAGQSARPGQSAWRVRRLGRWVPLAVSGLVLAQIGVLAAGFRLSQAFPPNADRVAGQRLVAAARMLGGTVAIPADPGVAISAGLPPAEDTVAAADVMRGQYQQPKTLFTASLARAVATQSFSGIITEFYRDLRGFPADLPRYYHRCPQTPPDGVLSVPFAATASALPVSVWLPRGHGPSCAAVARTLESQES